MFLEQKSDHGISEYFCIKLGKFGTTGRVEISVFSNQECAHFFGKQTHMKIEIVHSAS